MEAENQQKNSGRVIGVPFPKGVSGNPNGRPKGAFSMVTLLEKKLQEVAGDDPIKRRIHAEIILDELLKRGRKDGITAKDIIDRIDGKPKQAIEHTGKDGGDIPIMITVTYE